MAGTREGPDWGEILRDHLLKLLSVKAAAGIEMGGLRADVRMVGDTWLWTVSESSNGMETSLASGCEVDPHAAARNASQAMARLLRQYAGH